MQPVQHIKNREVHGYAGLITGSDVEIHSLQHLRENSGNHLIFVMFVLREHIVKRPVLNLQTPHSPKP